MVAHLSGIKERAKVLKGRKTLKASEGGKEPIENSNHLATSDKIDFFSPIRSLSLNQHIVIIDLRYFMYGKNICT